MPNGQPTLQLSKRELQVLELVVTGASNQEIAQKLVISINTVKVHMRNIFEKLEVQSRTEATLRAIQEGLVIVPDSEAEASEEQEPSVTPKTYLVTPTTPMTIPRWQRIYLLLAALAGAAVGLLPLLPRETPQPMPQLSVPVIYSQPPTPTPPANGATSRWVAHNPMPTNRAGLALVSLNEQIFAIGGVRANNRATRLVEIHNSATDSWVEGDSKPTATANIAGVLLDEKIYVPGGCTNEGKAIKNLEIYDPQADRWSQGPALPQPRCGYGLVTFEEQLYLFGGWNGSQFEDTIFIFSPQDNRWETSETSLPHPLGYMGVAVLDEAIYLVGGYDGQDEFAETYRFDPKTGAWLPKASLQEKRGGLGLVSNGQNLYAIGGGWEHTLTTSEKYNPNTNTWSQFETPYASQWRNLGVTIVDTKIYAVGGWDGTENQYMNTVVSYQFLYQFFLPLSGF